MRCRRRASKRRASQRPRRRTLFLNSLLSADRFARFSAKTPLLREASSGPLARGALPAESILGRRSSKPSSHAPLRGARRIETAAGPRLPPLPGRPRERPVEPASRACWRRPLVSSPIIPPAPPWQTWRSGEDRPAARTVPPPVTTLVRIRSPGRRAKFACPFQGGRVQTGDSLPQAAAQSIITPQGGFVAHVRQIQ